MRLPVISRMLLVLTVAVVGIASRSEAATIILPAGLNPGDHYRLIFVTSTTRDATSSNIADYNDFVSAVAASNPDLFGLGVTWTAIGSTDTVNATDNIGASLSTVGIYRLDGAKVAAGTAGLFSFDGTMATYILAPVNITESGNAPVTLVWTGTADDGHGAGPYSGVMYTLGSTNVLAGGLDYDWLFYDVPPATSLLPMYAISSEITVMGDAAVPEPGCIGLTALGAAFLLFARWRKDHSRGGARARNRHPE